MNFTEKRHGLAKRIVRFLQINGYETKRNVVIEGKSGTKHKVNILAVKSDAVTKIKIILECKAWNKSIGKDVVSKVNYVTSDIGANKGIIICFSSRFGFSKGAKTAAEKLGIELWDREELRSRLEAVETLSQLYQLEAKPERALTISPKIVQADAMKIAMNAKSLKEKLEFTKFVYLPFYLFQFTCAVKKGFIRKKESVKVLWSLCESIEGKHYPVMDSSVRFIDIHPEDFDTKAPIIAPKLKSATIRNEIEEACSELGKFDTSSAVQSRHSMIQQALGRLEAKPRIHSVKELYYPFFVALLREESKARWFVIDGYTGRHSEEMSAIFNHNFSYIQKFVS